MTTGLPSISEVISNRRSALFGHLARLHQDVPAHKALHCHVDLSLGRPRTQRPVETSSGPTTREMDRSGPEGQRNPPGGSVEACDESWSPRSNATALAGFALTTMKVDDFGTNRKRVYDFLLVGHCDYGPILHRFEIW